MRYIIFSLSLFTIFSLPLGDSFAASSQGRTTPLLPFEQYFAAKRGDSASLKFNDFSGKISASRIKKLLRSGSLLGDRVLLKNNAALYFPDGYIVSFSIRLERWRAKAGLPAESVRSREEVEPNPDYVLAESVEDQLGRVCADIAPRNPQEQIQVRKSSSGVLSLVRSTQGRFDHIVGDQSRTISITSALDPNFLSQEYSIQSALSSCI